MRDVMEWRCDERSDKRSDKEFGSWLIPISHRFASRLRFAYGRFTMVFEEKLREGGVQMKLT